MAVFWKNLMIRVRCQ